MTSKISGIRAARASRPAHLSLAPEPGGPAAPYTSAADGERTDREQAAFLAGILAAREAYLAGQAEKLDLRYRALAGIDRLEEMDLDELDELIEIASAVAHTKRTARPALRLVTTGPAAKDGVA